MRRPESIVRAEREGWLTTIAAQETSVIEAVLAESNGVLAEVVSELRRGDRLLVPFTISPGAALQDALKSAEAATAPSRRRIFIGVASAAWAATQGVFSEGAPQRSVERPDFWGLLVGGEGGVLWALADGSFVRSEDWITARTKALGLLARA